MPANDDTPAQPTGPIPTVRESIMAILQAQTQELKEHRAHAELIHHTTRKAIRELTVRIHDLENEVTNLRSTIRRQR